MSFYPELDSLSLKELIDRFSGPSLGGPEYAAVYYQEVALLIAQQETDSADYLLGVLEDSNLDTDRLRSALMALTQLQPEHSPMEQRTLRQLLSQYLYDQRPLIVAEAVDGLWRQNIKDVRDAALRLQAHPPPYVCGSVLRYISHLYPSEAMPLLVDALHDDSSIVRENAVDELDWLGAANALCALRPLTGDPDPHVRQAAETAIANLSAIQEGAIA